MAFESKAGAGVETGAKCPKCGTWHAAGALCPRCALSFALEDGHDGESDPESEETVEGNPAPTPPAGAVPPPKFAHFTLERDGDGHPVELGRGGMGVTYLATDRHLHIKVALKVIAPSRVGDRAAQALFFREARAAAKVRHSHVASVLYLSEPPGNVFYAMEFVPGESLRRWIERRAPVPPLLAISLVEQIARGLGAIHHEGIVHRDLKPGNVMLLPAPRSSAAGPLDPLSPDAWHAKIIDFGLARFLAPEAAAGDSAEASKGFLGTALYASPEQCMEKHDLDGRADLYSLGCILFELLTGSPPFKARTHRELMNLHVASAPPLERLEHLPAPLTAIMARLLVKEPEDRFADADALVKALGWARGRIEDGAGMAPMSSAPRPPRVTPHLFPSKPATVITPAAPIPFSPTPEFSRPSDSKLRRIVHTRPRFVAAGLGMLLLLAGIFGWQAWRTVPPEPPPEDSRPATTRSLAVLPFASLSSDKENAYFAEGLHAEILSSLTRLGDLKVISRLSVERYKPGSERDLKKIAAELGVGTILSGSVQREGATVRVKLELVEVATNRALWATSTDRTLTNLLSVQNEVALEVGERLLLRLNPAAKQALMRPAASSATAYQHFLRARALMGNVTSARQDLNEAAEALEAALAAEPNYALAHAQLSQLHMLFYAWGRDRTDQRLSLAWKHADAAARTQPDLPEVQLAFGTYHYRGFQDYERALPFFRRVLAAMPGNTEALLAVASITRRQGQWASAVENSLRVGENSPFEAFVQYNVVNTLIYVRDYERASQVVERALVRSPRHPALMKIRGELALTSRGDLRAMREDLAVRSPESPTPELYLLDYTRLLCLEGRFEDALAAAQASRFELAEGELTYTTRAMLLADLMTRAGRADAVDAWRECLPHLRELARQRPQDPRLRLAHALVLAGAGAVTEARGEADAAEKLLSVESDAFLGPLLLHEKATILRRCGDREVAELIEKRLGEIPAPFSEVYFRTLRLEKQMKR